MLKIHLIAHESWPISILISKPQLQKGRICAIADHFSFYSSEKHATIKLMMRPQTLFYSPIEIISIITTIHHCIKWLKPSLCENQHKSYTSILAYYTLELVRDQDSQLLNEIICPSEFYGHPLEMYPSNIISRQGVSTKSLCNMLTEVATSRS